MNNIFVYSNNELEYIKYVSNVPNRLERSKLHIDINKYELYTIRTKNLGLIIILGGIKIDINKVKAIVL